jgi:hypothetical protein
VSIKMTSWLMLFRKTAALFSGKRTKPIKMICAKTELVVLKQSVKKLSL